MNLNFRMFLIHLKYICLQRKRLQTFNLTFLTEKIVPIETEHIYTYFKDIYFQEVILPLLMVARKFFATLDTTKGVYKWYLSG